jgi:intracellular multiplication protein IcmK
MKQKLLLLSLLGLAGGFPLPGIAADTNSVQGSTSLTPEQSKELLKQAKQLNPDQLQAIAKSFQQYQDTSASASAAAAAAPPPPPPPPPARVAVAAPSAAGPQVVEVAHLVHEKSVEEIKNEDAFNTLMKEVLPLSPDQIMQLHKFYDLTQQAKAASPSTPPTPHFSSTVVNLEPGSIAPVVRLAAGFVTSLLFIDATGAAWPITAYSIGDPQNFNIQWDQKSNAMFIQSLKQYSHGNLAVRLNGLDTPIMITLVSGQKNVDFRVDLQIQGRGPDAKAAVIETTFHSNVNPVLINILDGVPPRGSIKLAVSGDHGEAWLADNKIYFRSRLTVLSPAWIGTVSSPDGMHVYELMLTPYIVASQNGRTVDIKLAGL